MGEHHAEVKAKLVLDDHATEALHKVKEGFHELKEKVQETQHEIYEFAKQAAATAVGFNFMNGVDSMKEFGHEVMAAAEEGREQEKTLAGVLLMTDRTGKSMGALRDEAHEVKEEFERLGAEAGAVPDEMNRAFAEVAERSNKSTDEVVDFTHKLFYASMAVSGGMSEISTGFAQIEMGTFRGTNAIVKLVTAQHLLSGNAKEVAKQMMNMTSPERIKLAEEAVERMAAKLKPKPGDDLPYVQVVQALKNVREQLFEAVGNPITDALGKQLNRLHRYFLDNQEQIEHWARIVGDKVGVWIKDAADKVQEGFEYLETHADEIEAAIKSGFEKAKEVVEFILAHKEAIAIAFGVKAMAPAIGEGVGLAKVGWGLAKAGTATEGVGLGTGIAAGGTAAAAILAASTAAAVAAWVEVGIQVNKLYHETDGFKNEEQRDIAAKMSALKKIAASNEELSKDELADFTRFKSGILGLADAAGENAGALNEQIEALWRSHTALTAQRAALDSAFASGQVDPIIAAYEKAQENNDTATEKYIAGLLDKSTDLQLAFVTAKETIAGGWDGLIALMSGTNGEGANQVDNKKNMAGLVEKMHPTEKSNLSSSVVNFNGGQTYNIKQDFRDGDPDKVALVFRNDILRHTENRVQARTGDGRGF